MYLFTALLCLDCESNACQTSICIGIYWDLVKNADADSLGLGQLGILCFWQVMLLLPVLLPYYE